MAITRESIEFDVLFVGGGCSSLAGAIRLMQLANEGSTEVEIAIIEKDAEICSHGISGAVMNPIGNSGNTAAPVSAAMAVPG